MLNGKVRKSLREYYISYYNGNFYRDIRYLYDGLEVFDGKYRKKICYDGVIRFNDVLNAKKFTSKSNSSSKSTNFLMSYKHDKGFGLLGSEIGYYKSLEDYMSGDLSKRYCDRLFFDFDIEDTRVDAIKNEINESIVKGVDNTKLINSLKKDFQALIFEDDLLAPMFEEAKRLCLYLENMALKPYLIFSGSKGFHVNLFFEELQLVNFSKISKRLGMVYSKENNLENLDYKVFDRKRGQRRLQRCQYAKHSKTNLYTIPIPEVYDYDDALALIKKNTRKPIEFNFEEYIAPEGFTSMIKKLDNQISLDNLKKQKEKNARRQVKIQNNKKKYHNNSFSEIDVREIARAYGVDGASDGEKIIVNCPFHNDKNPSGVVFENGYYCSSDNCSVGYLNYYGFIAKMEGLDPQNKKNKPKIMEKLHGIID